MPAEKIPYCLNCETDLNGLIFCGKCGQRNVHRRLVWRVLADDFNTQILELNLPWLKTLRDLTISPAKVCSDYADGRRIDYVNPLKYVFYMIAVITLLMSSLEVLSPDERGLVGIPAIPRFIFSNVPVFLLLLSPIAIGLFRLAFWTSGRNWVEVSCFVFYMLGHCAILLLLNVMVNEVSGILLEQGFSNGVVEVTKYIGNFLGITIIPLYVGLTAGKFFSSRLDRAFVTSLLIVAVYLLSSLGIFALVEMLNWEMLNQELIIR